MIHATRIAAGLLSAGFILSSLPASAESRPAPPDGDPYPSVGVHLSPREKEMSRPVRLSNGKVVLRPRSEGLPFLYGVGSAIGKASGAETINGVTPSVDASTPSDGIVAGQEPN